MVSSGDLWDFMGILRRSMVFNKKLNIPMGFYDFYGGSINNINNLASGGRRTGGDG